MSSSPVPDPSLRASDADRDRVATTLRDHAAAGRLDPEELDHRLDVALSARTNGELEALTRDLPTAPGPVRNVERQRALHRAGAAFTPFIVCVAIWAFSGGGSFWPVWILLVTVLGAGGELWRAFGPGRDLTDEELDDPRHRPDRRESDRGSRRRRDGRAGRSGR